MRIRFTWTFLVAALLWCPAAARAQSYEVPATDFTGPLSHPRYEEGGPFVVTEFVYLRENRPLHTQVLGNRGFTDTAGNLSGTAGTFIGSGDVAISTQQLRGPGDWQPGSNVIFGYRFEDGLTIYASWLHLIEARYGYTATIIPPNGNVGNQLENTFISSPVVNFPLEFAGNPINVATSVTPGDTFGIWNASSLQRIYFTQRMDIYELTGRIPMWQTESFRNYGLFGPRIIGMWERFKWQVLDDDLAGNNSPATVADYSNVVSNRLYGVHLGQGADWYLGSTPVGSFNFFVDGELGGYVDFAKLRAKYYRDDRSFGIGRARNTWTLAPSAEAKLGLQWRPWEAIEVQVGYQYLAIFNTLSSPKPVDFNFGAIDPEYDHHTLRWIHGLDFGIAFVF